MYEFFRLEEFGLFSFSHHDDLIDGKEGILKPIPPPPILVVSIYLALDFKRRSEMYSHL